jgi:O-methyltransferase
MLKKLIKKMLPEMVLNGYRLRHFNKSDYHLLPKKDITYSNDLLYTFHNADFMLEPKFDEAYKMAKEIGGQLLKDYDIQWRMHVLCWAGSQASKLEGDFVDCGVFTGFCPRAVMHYVDFQKLDKTYYLMDTFEGMDETVSSEYEMQRNKKLGYTAKLNLYEQVQQTFKGFRTDIIKGSIPGSLQQVKTKKVCYLSIDMNSVKPEIAALEFFWDKMVSGGLILSLPTCQGLIIKP